MAQLESKTFFDLISIDITGTILIRYKKASVLPNGIVKNYEYHRTSIEPGIDPDAQLDAVNTHLTRMGEDIQRDDPTFSAITRAHVKNLVAQVHTPEFVQAFKARQAAERAMFLTDPGNPTPPIH